MLSCLLLEDCEVHNKQRWRRRSIKLKKIPLKVIGVDHVEPILADSTKCIASLVPKSSDNGPAIALVVVRDPDEELDVPSFVIVTVILARAILES